MKRLKDKNLITGFILTGIILITLAVSFFYTPYDPYKMDASHRFLSPCIAHLLGTDNFGRDILSRVMVGTRYTVLVAFLTVLFSSAAGIIAGLFSGYFGGMLDEIIMRLNDALTAFPGILLALVLVTVMSQSTFTVILALSIVFTPSFSRIVRSATLQFNERDFIKSAVLFGASPIRIMFLHILPNVMPLVLTSVTIGFTNAILAESGMSYLGFGIQPPTPSWGRMLFEAQSYLFNAPWYALSVGIILIITVVGMNYISEGLKQSD